MIQMTLSINFNSSWTFFKQSGCKLLLQQRMEVAKAIREDRIRQNDEILLKIQEKRNAITSLKYCCGETVGELKTVHQIHEGC